MTINEQQQRLDAMLQPLPVGAVLFPPSSRYHGLGTAVMDQDGDRPTIYLRRRVVPHPEALAAIGRHQLAATERPDHIAAAEFGDPELFWRLCDANRVVYPADLVAVVGRWLRVAMPAGIPGAGHE